MAQAAPVHADSWLPPEPKEYLSPDGKTRLTVTPPDFEGSYPDSRPTAGAEGVLEQRRTDGSWAERWRQHLSNEIAPVEAKVCDAGRCVVTFDNWGEMGYGDNVVVIYGPGGEVVSSMGLDDFLPDDHIEGLSHSVSSIWWGGEHQFSADQNQIHLAVSAEGEDPYDENPEYDTIVIDLKNGEIVSMAKTDGLIPLWAVFALVALLVVYGTLTVLLKRRRIQ